MVQNIERGSKSDRFPYAPLADMQGARSYFKRNPDGSRETWDQCVDRVLYSPNLGLFELGRFTDKEKQLIDEELRNRRGFGSARFLWVGGTEWANKPDNYSSCFNCTSMRLTDWDTFGNLMDLAMMGSGTGAVLELESINQLPDIINKLNVSIIGSFGDVPESDRIDETLVTTDGDRVEIIVGDSRKGWVKSYQVLLEIASCEWLGSELEVIVDISNVRPKGSKLKGFGGIANPAELPRMYLNVAKTLNKAVGRKLTGLECCLIIGDSAYAVVAGGIRRSAGMKQGSPEDETFITSKENLWVVDDKGVWKIDPERDGLRTSNHTVVYHHKPSLEECVESVTKQFHSGEGAIQYAPEAIVRANVDLLDTESKRNEFLVRYEISKEAAGRYLSQLAPGKISPEELEHRLHRYGLNPLTLAA